MIHLIVGNTGSGKTTYAHKLKDKVKSVIFSIDKWNNTLFIPDKKEGDALEWFLERIERSETLILNLVTQLEAAGVDAILDLGLSKQEHREKFRAFAKANNFDCTLHFLDIPKEIRWHRVLKRNTTKGATYEFDVTEENFEFMENWFENPTEKELINGIIIND